MTKAYDLPKIALDIKGDRLRFLMAECIEECELQYRRGKFDKAESLMNFITAAAGPLSVLGVVGSVVVGNVTANNIVTAAEAASPVTATVTYTNVSNGRTAIVLLDGVTNAGVTISAASANAATITLTSAVATALSIGSHTLTVIVIDDAGVGRTVIKGFSRSA